MDNKELEKTILKEENLEECYIYTNTLEETIKEVIRLVENGEEFKIKCRKNNSYCNGAKITFKEEN